MPWIAQHDGEKKGAWQVPSGEDAFCVECGERMRVWRESRAARHFKHIGNMGGGGGQGNRNYDPCEVIAESDKHIKWKNLAAERLSEVFEGNVSECRVEKSLDAPVSGKENRVGDAVLSFDDPDEQLGEGIVVEVQYRNHAKDVEETTEDYVEQGYSVVWTYEDDYSSDHCLLSEIDFRSRAQEQVWPDYVPRKRNWRVDKYEYYRIQNRWRKAWEQGLCQSGAPATLPTEWCDEKARELWEGKEWWRLFKDPYSYPAEEDIKQVRSEMGLSPIDEIEVTLPMEWCDEVAQKMWLEQDWNTLFPSVKADRLDAMDYTYQYEVYQQDVRESLNEPLVNVHIGMMFPAERVWDWHMQGLSEHEEVHSWVPDADEWTGYYEYHVLPTEPNIEVRFPKELPQKHEETLRLHWELGSGVIDLDLSYRLSENNAPRRCILCGEGADFYLFKDDVVSEYRCENHARLLVDDGEEVTKV